VNDKAKQPTEEQLRLLIDSMCSQLADRNNGAAQVVNTLIRETVKFRDKLKVETGEILTVGDTRVALEALTEYLSGRKLTNGMTPEQKALTQIWIDRLTLFRAS
jgi:hypothetical protein